MISLGSDYDQWLLAALTLGIIGSFTAFLAVGGYWGLLFWLPWLAMMIIGVLEGR